MAKAINTVKLLVAVMQQYEAEAATLKASKKKSKLPGEYTGWSFALNEAMIFLEERGVTE